VTDPVVRLDVPRLSVEPGGQARTTVTVRNTGTIVEGFRITVVGNTVDGWAQVLPDKEVQVYPGQEASATIVFSAPAGIGSNSGSYPFGVHAESVVDASSSAVAEGDLEVGRVFGLQSKLTPVTSQGRWRGKHRIDLTNWGNAPVRLRLVASDPDERLAFLITPEILEVPLGSSGQARLKVKTRDPFLRGTPVRLPFQVVGEPDPPEQRTGPQLGLADPKRAAVDGAFTQQPILSRFVVVAATLLVVALAGLTALSLFKDDDKRPTFEEAGTPPAPTVTAEAVGSQQIALSWEQIPQIQAFQVFQVSEDGAQTLNDQEVSGEVNSFTVDQLTPETQYCFQVLAKRGDFSSPRSAPVCAMTGAEEAGTGSATPPASTDTQAPTTTPPTGGSGTVDFLPTDYVAILFTIPAEQPDARAQAEAKAQELSTETRPALVLDTTEYPDMGLIEGQPFNPSFLVYVGPFASLSEADTYCGSPQPSGSTGCLPAQPSPNG